MSSRTHFALNPATTAVVATVLLAIFFGSALFASYLSPYDPTNQEIQTRLLPPVGFGADAQWAHPFGTDQLGRDELSRLIWGARITSAVLTSSILAATVIGTLVGLMCGYFGGWFDLIGMRIVDIQLSIPPIILALALAAVLKPGVQGVVIILIAWSWAPITRVVRAETLSQRERDYVHAATALGATSRRVMLRHILPNVLPSLLVLATLNVGRFVIFESGLSFLGLGVQEPTPAWGSMLAAARTLIVDAWWLAVIPGVAIMGISLSANMLGDYLTDRFDPRRRRRA